MFSLSFVFGVFSFFCGFLAVFLGISFGLSYSLSLSVCLLTMHSLDAIIMCSSASTSSQLPGGQHFLPWTFFRFIFTASRPAARCVFQALAWLLSSLRTADVFRSAFPPATEQERERERKGCEEGRKMCVNYGSASGCLMSISNVYIIGSKTDY